MSLNITESRDNEKIIFMLEGRLDTTTAQRLQSVLSPIFDEAAHIELNFAKLDYISSAGLRVLLLAQKMTKAKDASMTLSNISEEILEVFEMTGFSEMLTIE